MVADELKRQLRGREPQVVDSNTLHELLIDQRLHRQDDLSVETAARIARELGAELAVLGHTHVFEVLDVGLFLDDYERWDHARVTLQAVIIDAHSGEVVGQEAGASHRAGAVRPWNTGDRPNTDIGDTRFRNSFLGRVTEDAVRLLAERIRGRVRKLTASGAWAWHDGTVVVGRGGGGVTINAGAEDGVAVGDRFAVVRVMKSGECVELGTVEVASVEARNASGPLTRAGKAPKPRIGDFAEPAG